MLNIVPTRNLINNIGIGQDATHGAGSVKELPRALRSVFNKKTYELNFPLRHPKFVINDTIYLEQLQQVLGIGRPVVNFCRGIESAMRRFYYADTNSKKEKILRLPATIKMLISKVPLK